VKKLNIVLFLVFLSISSLSAKDNKAMSDEEFIKKFLSSKKEVEKEKLKLKKIKEQNKKLDEIIEDIKKAKNQKTTKE